MSAPLELQVWLKLALGFCILVALFVALCWLVALYDIVRIVWKARRR